MARVKCTDGLAQDSSNVSSNSNSLRIEEITIVDKSELIMSPIHHPLPEVPNHVSVTNSISSNDIVDSKANSRNLLVSQFVRSVRQFVKENNQDGAEHFIRTSNLSLDLRDQIRKQHDRELDSGLVGMNAESNFIDKAWEKLKQELRDGAVPVDQFCIFQNMFELIHNQKKKKTILILSRFFDHAIDRANFQLNYVLNNDLKTIRVINDTFDKMVKEKHAILSAPQVSTANLGSQSVLEALKHESLFVQFVVGLVFLFGVYHAITFLLPFFMWSSSAIQEIVKNIKWW